MKLLTSILLASCLLGCKGNSGPPGYHYGSSSTARSRTYLPDFDELWDYSSPSDTELRFQELLLTAKRSNNLEYQAQLRTQIARAQGLQRDFLRAHKTLDSVEKELSAKTPVARIRYLLERGRVFNSSGSPERAKPLVMEAWEEGRRVRAHSHAVDAAHMLAIVDSRSALHWNQTALQYAESCGDERAMHWRGALYNNLGWMWHGSKEYDKALAMFRKDFVFRVESKDDSGARIAKWSIARTLRSLDRIEEALDMQRDLALELEQIGQVDGFVHEELGELLLKIGQRNPSKEQFGRAYDALSQDANFVANNSARLGRIRRLGVR